MGVETFCLLLQMDPVIAVKPGSYSPGRRLEDSSPGNLTRPRGSPKSMIAWDSTKSLIRLPYIEAQSWWAPAMERQGRQTKVFKPVRNASTPETDQSKWRKATWGKETVEEKENIQIPIDNNLREVCEDFESIKLEQVLLKSNTQKNNNNNNKELIEINKNLWAEMKALIHGLENKIE